LSKRKHMALHNESLFSFESIPCRYYSLEGLIQEPTILNDFQPWKGQYQFKKNIFALTHVQNLYYIEL